MNDQNGITYTECQVCHGTGKMPDASTGAVLRTEREKAGLSLAVVASALNMSAAYLGDLERGSRRWDNQKVEEFRAAIKELMDRKIDAALNAARFRIAP